MYLRAPIQKMYPGIHIEITHNQSRISLPLSHKFFHAGGSVHGSIYFRLLDDAAYFAVSSSHSDFFILTASFHIDLIRPVSNGVLYAKGKLIKNGRKLMHAKSELRDDKGKLVAVGKGTFAKSNIPMSQVEAYENQA
ncbi:MAG: PaaI family thioesterase [Vicingaceae bacterium]